MHEELIRRLNETKTMSIVGMCKNAGKTTMLNWLLTGGHLRGTLGLTSIGRDGESTDVVNGTEKPGFFVREGTLIATAKDMLRSGHVTKEILMTTGIPTPLGEVVILRARSAGYVQLAGPSITTQLRSVSESFFALGAEKSVIDGALGRKSLGARAVADGVILCTGASYNASMEKVIAATVHIYRLMNLPKAEPLPPVSPDGRAPGADTLDKLAVREVALETEGAARTLCVTVNPVSAYGWKFDKDGFLHRMREAVDVPVINVKEELA